MNSLAPPAVRERWRFYTALAATWLILAGLLQGGARVYSAGFSTNVSPWTYLLNQTVMLVRYLRLAVWPSALVVNYGWPRATHGIDYNGSIISPNKSLPGMEDPVRVWVPSISPSGLCFYTGDRFPGWKGSVFTGALSNDALFRIELDGERYRGEERLLVERLPYIRDVRQGPDGLLYLVTHTDDGGLFRIEPA